MKNREPSLTDCTQELGRQEVHIDVINDDMGAVDLISDRTALSRGRVKQAMDRGAVWLTRGARTKRLRRAKRPLIAGDSLHLYYDSAVLMASAPAPVLVADQGDYSVWDKPCRLFSQGTKWGDHCTVTRYAEKHLRPQRNAFIVHRLDRAASGLILVGHSKKVTAALSRLFRHRAVEKHYRVSAQGYIGVAGESFVLNAPLDGKSAHTQITVGHYEASTDVSDLDVSIATGRKHQIRRHLSEIGCPVVGDRLYGSPDTTTDMKLRAYALSFQCPLADAPVNFQVNA